MSIIDFIHMGVDSRILEVYQQMNVMFIYHDYAKQNPYEFKSINMTF